MKYNELQAGAHKDKKRVGRGISAGGGKTAGRGTKGQNSRTGKKLKATFMGGQRSLVQAIPKSKGFKSIRVPAQVVYLDQLNDVKGATIDVNTLFEAGLISTPYHSVKIIAARKNRDNAEYTGKATLKVQAASASVVAAIAKAGGKFEAVEVSQMPASNTRRAAARAEKAENKTA